MRGCPSPVMDFCGSPFLKKEKKNEGKKKREKKIIV